MIDIGRYNGSTVYYSNQVASEPTALFGRQANLYDPPPYFSQSAPRFCSHCGAVRQDLTNKLCLSCGQTFDNY